MKRRSRKSGRPTLSNVAELAGVSAITVSRALRNPARVSPDLRNRIERAVAELGYVPDFAAQSLASSRSDVIGVLIPSVTNNVFSDVMRGIYDMIEEGPFRIQTGNTRYSEATEEKLLRVFLSQRPAALIVAGIDQSKTARALLEEARCPVVQIMETGDDPVDMLVGLSHRDGAFAGTSHLVRMGYRRIAFIGARMDPRSRRRLEGYSNALKEAGLFDQRLVCTTTRASSITLGAEMLGELVAAAPDADAVFCNNDDMAAGALFECQRRGIAVPDRFGICGFNNLEMTAVTCPPLTSVETHRYQMGRLATQMAMAAIVGEAPERKIVDLGFRLVKRESTRRPG